MVVAVCLMYRWRSCNVCKQDRSFTYLYIDMKYISYWSHHWTKEQNVYTVYTLVSRTELNQLAKTFKK